MFKRLLLYALVSTALFSCSGVNHPKEKDTIPAIIPKSNHAKYLTVESVAGFFSSATNEKLIYVSPDEWSGEEGVNETLHIRDLRTGKDKKLLDSIDASEGEGNSDPLSDTSFIICDSHKIYVYNDKRPGKKLLYKTAANENIERMKLSPDGKTIAFFIQSGIDQKIYLLFYDIDKSIVTYKQNYNYISSEADGESTSLKWVDKSVAFNINNDLYIIDTSTGKFKKITGQLAYGSGYDFDGNNIVYYQDNSPNQRESTMIYYNLENKTFGSATFNLNVDSLKLHSKLGVTSSFINNRRFIFLTLGKTTYQLKNQNWQKVEQAALFESKTDLFSNRDAGKKNYIIVSKK